MAFLHYNSELGSAILIAAAGVLIGACTTIFVKQREKKRRLAENQNGTFEPLQLELEDHRRLLEEFKTKLEHETERRNESEAWNRKLEQDLVDLAGTRRESEEYCGQLYQDLDAMKAKLYVSERRNKCLKLKLKQLKNTKDEFSKLKSDQQSQICYIKTDPHSEKLNMMAHESYDMDYTSNDMSFGSLISEDNVSLNGLISAQVSATLSDQMDTGIVDKTVPNRNYDHQGYSTENETKTINNLTSTPTSDIHPKLPEATGSDREAKTITVDAWLSRNQDEINIELEGQQLLNEKDSICKQEMISDRGLIDENSHSKMSGGQSIEQTEITQAELSDEYDCFDENDDLSIDEIDDEEAEEGLDESAECIIADVDTSTEDLQRNISQTSDDNFELGKDVMGALIANAFKEGVIASREGDDVSFPDNLPCSQHINGMKTDQQAEYKQGEVSLESIGDTKTTRRFWEQMIAADKIEDNITADNITAELEVTTNDEEDEEEDDDDDDDLSDEENLNELESKALNTDKMADVCKDELEMRATTARRIYDAKLASCDRIHESSDIIGKGSSEAILTNGLHLGSES